MNINQRVKMGESQNTVWHFFKNISNKFSISDLVNGNDKKGTTNSGRKHISYNQLETHDKGDFLSSSNPNLFDIVGSKDSTNTSATTTTTTKTDNALEDPKTKKSPPKVSSEVTVARFGFGAFSGPKPKDPNASEKVTTKKFTFPNRVPSYQAEQDEKGCESENDSNWFGNSDGEGDYNEDDDDDHSTDFEDDLSEDGRKASRKNRCGYCGCEKKYEIT